MAVNGSGAVVHVTALREIRFSAAAAMAEGRGDGNQACDKQKNQPHDGAILKMKSNREAAS